MTKGSIKREETGHLVSQWGGKCLCLIGDSSKLQLGYTEKKFSINKFFAEKEGNFPTICLVGCQQGWHFRGTKGSCCRQSVLLAAAQVMVVQLQADKREELGGFLSWLPPIPLQNCTDFIES